MVDVSGIGSNWLVIACCRRNGAEEVITVDHIFKLETDRDVQES